MTDQLTEQAQAVKKDSATQFAEAREVLGNLYSQRAGAGKDGDKDGVLTAISDTLSEFTAQERIIRADLTKLEKPQ